MKKIVKKTVLIAVCVAAINPFLTLFFVPQATAASVESLSPKRKFFYRLAATQYWGTRGELRFAGGDVPCQPFDTDIHHVKFGEGQYAIFSPSWSAGALNWGAYPPYPKSGYRTNDQGAAIKYDDFLYCTVFYNTKYREDSRSACISFIHEYGHLLGHDHTSDINSPMYANYEDKSLDPTLAAQLQVRNIKNRLANSICHNLRRQRGGL